MSTIIETNFDDVVEPRTADADSEVKVRIVSAKMDMDKNNLPYLLPRFEVADDEYAKEFTQFIRLPHEEMNKKEMNNAKFRLKNFYDCFGIDYSRGVDAESDLPGNEGWVILGIEEQQGEERNYIKSYIKPR